MNHQGMGGGIVGRNNRLSFSETKMGLLVDLAACDSNGASLCCVERLAVGPRRSPQAGRLRRQ
jgi:hypothetical protein